MMPELAAHFLIFSAAQTFILKTGENGTEGSADVRRKRGADIEVLQLGGELEDLEILAEFKAALDALASLEGDCLKIELCGLATNR